MIEIGIYRTIASEDERALLQMFGQEDMVFSAENVQKVFAENPEEKDFKFNINCNGGSVAEGLRIYDVLRTSGKNLYMNIEQACHSMALTVLLAAPKENRTANPNARALIHRVRQTAFEYFTAEEYRKSAEQLELEEENILDIYADRTGTDKDELRDIMYEEKERTASELINLGFISKINSYSTNLKKEQMAKNAQTVLARIKNLLNMSDEVVNFDFTDADGNVLFSTDAADDALEVGMNATPDGTFTIADGRTITIADGVITEIIPASENNADDDRIAELENTLQEAMEVIENQRAEIVTLKNQIRSNYKPANRMGKPDKVQTAKTAEEYKTELAEKRNKMKGGK
jgi:ATP-dependent Clp protease protease subunit